MLIRSLIYGLLGWVIEIIWTALPKRRPVDWTLTGHTYLWMLPIYALIGPLYEPVHSALRRAALARARPGLCGGVHRRRDDHRPDP